MPPATMRIKQTRGIIIKNREALSGGFFFISSEIKDIIYWPPTGAASVTVGLAATAARLSVTLTLEKSAAVPSLSGEYRRPFLATSGISKILVPNKASTGQMSTQRLQNMQME